MLGRTSRQIHHDDDAMRGNIALYMSLAAVALSVIGLFTANSAFLGNQNSTGCTQIFNSRPVISANQAIDSISAYDLWLSLGNTGTQDDFLNSLVGTNGRTGFNGQDGQSAFQVWLANGNQGTVETFLAEITGKDGETGADGLSAYELWLMLGNQGSLSDFMNSLVGPSGAAGPTGATGATGSNGICTIGVGYYGSFWDENPQSVSTGVTTFAIGKSGSTSGVDANGSKIVFAKAGTYNIAFSAQLVNEGGSKLTASIWLRHNGQNVPYTNTNIAMSHSNDEYVAAWNFFLDVNAGDYVELAAHSSAPGLMILAQPESTSGGVTIPGIPSIILTVNQVR